MDPKVLKYALILIEFTSIPLLLLGLIYFLTGYQMLLVTIHIFPNARIVHTDRFLRVLTLILAVVHSYSGILIITARRVRSILLKKFIIYFATLVIIIFMIIATTMELTSR